MNFNKILKAFRMTALAAWFMAHPMTAVAAPEISVTPLSFNLSNSVNREIFVEIDWMDGAGHSHKPSQAVIDRIVATFARDGFIIHIDVSNAIAHQDVLAVTNSPSSSSAIQAISNANFNHKDDSRYFYSIWGHDYSYNGGATGSSGIADLPGRIHLVTLGSFSGQTGTENNQVGTFIHEFGHNLSQLHGGTDSNNYKPNYVSVMNYHYQLDGIGSTLVTLGLAKVSDAFNNFGYSHGTLPDLDENHLNETVGIGLGKAVDWNGDGNTTGTDIAHDLNAEDWTSAFGTRSVITDYDNWGAINASVRSGVVMPGLKASPTPSEPCITARDYDTQLTFLKAMGAKNGIALTAGVEAGAVPVNGFTITNEGTQPLSIFGIVPETEAPWLTVSPAIPMSIPPGGSRNFAVAADFTQAPVGSTTTRMLVLSDDPDEGTYPGGVNVTVNVDSETSITIQPENKEIEYNQTANLTVSATGSNLSYQWFQGISGSLNMPVGLNSPSFTTPPLKVSTSYWVRVSSGVGFVNSDTAEISISEHPSNDNFANATVLSGTFGTVTGNNVNATKETGEPNHANNTASGSVWYKWVAPISGTATIDTMGSSFDTLLASYKGSAVNSLTPVSKGSNDDADSETQQSRVTFNMVSGTTYQFAVIGYAGPGGGLGNTGGITLNYTITPIPLPVISSLRNAKGYQGTPFTYTITAINSPTSFNATGLPEGLNVNTATGVISGTPTSNGTFTVNLTATNVSGPTTTTMGLTIGASAIDLKKAMDAPALTWVSGGSANWFGQASTAHDGPNAAQSGGIGNSQTTYTETTVAGPCKLTFWWKVSSEANKDLLTFYIDGVSTDAISGEVDWHKMSYMLAAGSHTLKWAYSKDVVGSIASDCGWVDQIEMLTPEIAVEQPTDNGLVDGTAKRDFGSVKVGKAGTAKTFVIRNTGTAKLTGLEVTKNGANPANFIVTTPAKTSLAPGKTTSFKVTFKPSAKGIRTATLHIKSSDTNESPFDIKLTGTGMAASSAFSSAP